MVTQKKRQVSGVLLYHYGNCACHDCQKAKLCRLVKTKIPSDTHALPQGSEMPLLQDSSLPGVPLSERSSLSGLVSTASLREVAVPNAPLQPQHKLFPEECSVALNPRELRLDTYTPYSDLGLPSPLPRHVDWGKVFCLFAIVAGAALIAGIIGLAIGTAVGVAAGSSGGPLGTFLGGLGGGTLGTSAGSIAGHAIGLHIVMHLFGAGTMTQASAQFSFFRPPSPKALNNDELTCDSQEDALPSTEKLSHEELVHIMQPMS